MVVSDSDKSSPVVHEKDGGNLKRKQDEDETDKHERKKVKQQTDKKTDDISTVPPEKNTGNKKTGIMNKMGGAYIPPARLRMMQAQLADKNGEQYQRMSWEALKKSINGLVNKVNISNIKEIVKELFSENIVRGRGLLARSIIQAQNASPTFTRVYAALVAVINTRFPQNGELVLRRLVLTFRKSFRRNKKDLCLHSGQFIAHLVNQQVAHEIIALQILSLMLETPSNDSVEVAVGFLKECGLKLSEVSPRGLAAVFERLRTVLHGEELDKRVQYMIEVMFAIRKDGFKEHPSVTEDLDLVEESDQFTHMLTLEEEGEEESKLNVFHLDPEFQQNEENYNQIKKEILDSSSDDGSGSSGSDSDSSSDEEGEGEDEKTTEIEDKTETNLVALRRTVYLAIQSSITFEECAHKLLKMEFAEKDYKEICAMIIDCCSQQRTYEKFFGLLGGRFCILKKEFMEHFETLFAEHYNSIHRLETNKLRNTAKFFGHLLHSDSLPWTVLSNIHLSEDTTTSSSRIFIKILFQELVEYCGLLKLNQRLKDETLAAFFEGLFPRNNPKDTRFAINFFTSIGLGGLTDELREHLKTQAHRLLEMQSAEHATQQSSESSDSSSSSEEEKKKKRKKNKKEKNKSKSKKKKSKTASSSSDSSSSSEDDKITKKKGKGSLKSRLLEMSNTVDKMNIKQQPQSDQSDDGKRKSKKKKESRSEKIRGKRESSSDESDDGKRKSKKKSESRSEKIRVQRESSSDESDDGKRKSKKKSESRSEKIRVKRESSSDERQKPRRKQEKTSEKHAQKRHDSSDSGSDEYQKTKPKRSDKRRDGTPTEDDEYRSKRRSDKNQRQKRENSYEDEKMRREKNRLEKPSDDDRDTRSRRKYDNRSRQKSEDDVSDDYRRSKMNQEEQYDRSRKPREDYGDREKTYADGERFQRSRERHRRRSRSRG